MDRDRRLTYSQSIDAIEHFAGALHHLGARRGDRVTIFAHNGMDYLMGMFACWRIGAIAALVNLRFADELEYYFNDHTPRIVIYTHDMGDAVRRTAAQASSSVKRLVCMDGPQEKAESLPDLLTANFAAPPDPGDEEAIAHLSYTSGTSGRPKGACLAHEPTTPRDSLHRRAAAASAGDDSCFGPTALSSSYQLVANLLPGLASRHDRQRHGSLDASKPAGIAMDATGATAFAANPTILSEVLVELRKRGTHAGQLRYGCRAADRFPRR